MSLRDILRNLNITRQEVNVGQFNNAVKEYRQEQAIKDSLRQQTKRDDIIIAQKDFVPLDVRRREQRIDENIKTSMALLVDGLNEESVPKLSSNLDRIQDIVLKENPSLSMLAQLKRFLGQLSQRMKEINIEERVDEDDMTYDEYVRLDHTKYGTMLNNKIQVISSLLQNKIITDDVMKTVLKDIETTVVDDLDKLSVEKIYSRLIPDGEKKVSPSLRFMKQEIKRVMGKNLEELKDPIASTSKQLQSLKDEIQKMYKDASTEDLAELFTTTLKGRINTKLYDDGEQPLDADDWRRITKSKSDMLNLISDYYSQPRVIDNVQSIEEYKRKPKDRADLINIVDALLTYASPTFLEDNDMTRSKLLNSNMDVLEEYRQKLLPEVFDIYARERASLPHRTASLEQKLRQAKTKAEQKRILQEEEDARAREREQESDILKLWKKASDSQTEDLAKKFTSKKKGDLKFQVEKLLKAQGFKSKKDIAKHKPQMWKTILESPQAMKSLLDNGILPKSFIDSQVKGEGKKSHKTKTKKEKKQKPIKLSKSLLKILNKIK